MKNKIVAVLSAVTLGASFGARAISYDTLTAGKVTWLDANPDIQPRGLCIQIAPNAGNVPFPGNGWACLAANNPMYREITALLQIAYVTQRSCVFGVNNATGSLTSNEIRLVECTLP